MNYQSEARAILGEAIERWGRERVAQELTRSPRTIERWQKGEIMHPGEVYHALSHILTADFIGREPEPESGMFTFVDLFAGIGGTRLGFEHAGGQCIFTSEWDDYCRKTYRANFGIDHPIAGDIRAVDPRDIPDHDVLVAGFPCQPFSIAGVSKKNSLGRAHGFQCETQGTLFFYIEKIIEAKRPAAFMLENVKNLQSHDNGRTFDVIMRTLRDKLGYEVGFKVIDGGAFTPQHRERIFIVGLREKTALDLDQVNLEDESLVVGKAMKHILHPEDGSEDNERDYTTGPEGMVNKKYILSPKLWKYLRDYKEKHQRKGNGFGYGLVGPEDTCRTLSARYYKDGSEILVNRGARRRPRRLTPRECARLMGFPKDFRIEVSDTQAYKQFGNSVVVPVIKAVARGMAPHVVALRDRLEAEDQYAMVV